MRTPWQPLLDWWFGSAVTVTEVVAARGGLWFGKQDSQDNEARERFAEQVEQALRGGLADWMADPAGWLALILLLDQLPRMIYRDTPQAFAGDRRAQLLVREGLAHGREAALAPIQQVFIYLVLEHAEDLPSQAQSVARFAALHAGAAASEDKLFAGYLDYAERHQRVIARFGRFPHRNSILGRASTAEEVSFLREPGSRF
ncbi:DUF924 domain-containing protein [Pseudomonas cavernicola]|uniref:DUF924 domain-containing protein n=1 Tax=Pseudomonas cavernicola TaxID=2320866 RepID=A0A418XKV2_9PSED|nr:DUF924 family protein [Pseudomonas cavernicola]RJG13087.1 DUF924 domain-containing protein [Pseudomonas cavernicola]